MTRMHQLNSEQLLPPLFTILYLGPMPHKLMVSPQVKKTPLPLLHRESLQLFSYHFFLLLCSSCLWASSSITSLVVSELLVLHSKDFSEVILLRVYLEIKALCYCTLYSVHSKVHKSTATCRGCVHMPMYTTHGN